MTWLRPAIVHDLATIDRIEQACFGNPWPEDAYAQELERRPGTLEVAALPSGEVVGFSCAWHVADEAHLLRIATHPAWWRRGIGRRLLDAAVSRARAASCKHMTLEVAAGNGAAVALYHGAGFREIGRRFGYYRSPPDDAIVMRLDF